MPYGEYFRPKPLPEGSYAFTLDERAKLTVYRAAVAAGFYTDNTPELGSRRFPLPQELTHGRQYPDSK